MAKTIYYKGFQMLPVIVRRSLKGALMMAVFTALGGNAMAQALAPAQGTANPGRVEQQFPALKQQPDNTPAIEVKTKNIEAAPKGAEKVSFTLTELHVDGATVYSRQDLASVYGGDIGHKITLAQLYDIAGRITLKYRNDGYILTQVVVPPQHISHGVARLRVVEGYVDRVNVQGARGHEQGLIESYARGLSRGTPLNVHDMERALLLVNDLPGVKARSILSPSKTKVGAADLTVIVTRKPYDLEFDANNFGTKYLGPYQLGASAALNSVLGLNERITGQTVYAPGAHLTPELMYYALGYLQPVGPYGTTVALNASYTDTNPGFRLKPFDVDGKSNYEGVTVAHPFIRSRQLNLSGHVTVDFRDVKTEDNIEPTRKDRIRTLRVGGKIDYLDTLFGRAAYNSADLELSQGLGLFGATDGGADTSRPGANDTFTKFNAELQRLQRVVPDVNLLLGATGQVSADKLFTSEEFGLGGQSYGRGYDPSEIIGDHGIAGKAELQWENPMRLSFLDTWQGYGFYDIGQTWTKDATVLADKRNSLASTGLGVRSSFTEGTGFDAYVAFPLTRDVATQSGRNPRVFVGLSQKF